MDGERMADSQTSVNISADNVTNITNATGRALATAEGKAVAYGSLVVMALLPILIGSFRSVKFHKEQKESGEKAERMTHRDAAMFPIFASCALFGIYIFFKLFSKEYINLLLAVYFFFLGVFALTHIASPFFKKIVRRLGLYSDSWCSNYHLLLNQDMGGDKKEELINYNFDSIDFVTVALSAIVGFWYLKEKHWLANNIFGLAFAVNGVEFLQLNKFSIGALLLCGLFVYDVFWVFATEVMVTVAMSFDAPVKLVFPQDLLENGFYGKNFAMLGLGDIVIPGILIALLLRFDVCMGFKNRPYFYSTFLAYFLGLMATIVVMHTFNHAQPALLYLVPACLITPLGLALARGEIADLFSYEDHTEVKDSKDDAPSETGPDQPAEAGTPAPSTHSKKDN